MAAKVSLINAGKDLWPYLCRQMPPPVALANYSSETQLSRVLKTGSLDANVIVLGHYLEDPLKFANRARAVSRGAGDYEAMRQDLDSIAGLREDLTLCSTVEIKALPTRVISSASALSNTVHTDRPTRQIDNVSVLNKKARLTPSDHIKMVDELLDFASAGFILLDRNRAITHVNQTACDLLRLDSRASSGAPIELVFAAREQNTMERLICQARAGGAGRTSGLSLCNYLKNLPVDYLKIDGSFVTDISEDRIDHAMVETINQPGHVMGIGAIAECAENQQVVDQLRGPGVDFAQGHAMGSPVPMDGLKLLH